MKTENVQIPFKGVFAKFLCKHCAICLLFLKVSKELYNFEIQFLEVSLGIGKIRHLGCMPEDSGRDVHVLVRKVRK